MVVISCRPIEGVKAGGDADNGRGSKRQRGPGGGVARARRLGGGGKVGVRV